MPLTFAHPAAVLPFSRKSMYINFLALVLGSMSPDFEYFLHGKPHSVYGHTFSGFILFNLPLVIIVYFLYKACIHRALITHLPSIFQDHSTPKVSANILVKSIVFLYSALLGMLTHVVWDSFTHIGGYVVLKLPFLTYTVSMLNLNIPIYKFLQHGSTMVGIILIIGYMYIRTKRNGGIRDERIKPIQKCMYWGQITVLTFLLFCLWYVIDEVSIQAYGIIVVRIIDSALISLLIVSLFFNHVIGKNAKLNIAHNK